MAHLTRPYLLRQLEDTTPAITQPRCTSAYLADLSGPLQLHHGTADTDVPVEFSSNLYQQAQEIKAPMVVEYYEYPGDNHNLSKSFSIAMQRSVAFFDQYVKNASTQAATHTP